MKDIQKREFIRSVELIKALGCTYKIITPEGESFGELQVVVEKTRKVRRSLKHPYGALTTHFKKFLDINAAIGVVQEIPCAKFDPAALRATICPTLTRLWGPKTYITAIHPDKVEVMRIATEAM